MKTNQLLILAFIVTFLFSCKNEKKREVENQKSEIELKWQEFLEVVEKKGTAEFYMLSNTTIRCYSCLENTEHERKVLEYLRDNDTTWYDKLYDEKIYIPIDKFIEEDFNLIFDDGFIEILKTGETIFSKREIDSVEAYEVLVTTTKPTLGHEGGQHAFQFRKEKEEFKLFEISTIP